jgi:hypothetical protein
MRLRALFSRRRVESELDEELSFHLAMEAAKNRSRGLGGDEAWRTAHREECRDARGVNAIENLVRVLVPTPVFTAVAVASLATGIGANTAVFSLVDTVLLRTLPARNADELVALGWSANDAPRTLTTSYSNSRGSVTSISWVRNIPVTGGGAGTGGGDTGCGRAGAAGDGDRSGARASVRMSTPAPCERRLLVVYS